MFVGHYAAALAAKSAEPRAPLWTYVIGCQLLDVGWGGLIMAGAEKVRVDPSLPGSPLDLYDMPWTHSLPGALAWSVAGAIAVRLALKTPWRAAVFVGLAVFSHWVLDFVVHRPDLLLFPGGPKVGLAFWNAPVPEQALELGLLAVAAVFWTAQRQEEGRRSWSAAAFIGFLVGLQFLGFTAPPSNLAMMGAMAWIAYGIAGIGAWLAERRAAPAAERLLRGAVRA